MVYAIWIGYLLPRSHAGVDFVFLGKHTLQQSTASSVISSHSASWNSRAYLSTMDYTGYDGQFYFFMALDPVHAAQYSDKPSYRYTRIVYPLLAHVLALNQTALIPYALILVNWLAVGGGTLAIAAWMYRKGMSPWLAALYGLYPGLFTATSLDTAEPLAYALVAVALYALEFAGEQRIWTAGVLFSLAALSRETTLIFPAVYAIALLIRPVAQRDETSGRALYWRQGAILAALAALPFVAYKVFLTVWLGGSGLSDYSLARLPLSGLFSTGSWEVWDTQVLRSVVVPALLCAAMGVWALWRRVWPAPVWALLLNVWVCVLCLQPDSFDPFRAPARIATGVVIAALLCVPAFDSLVRTRSILLLRWWLIVCGLLWLWLDLNWLQELLQIYTGCGRAGYGWALALIYHCSLS
jgi:hypothetical protein